MVRARRVDDNQPAVVALLRSVYALSVQTIHQLGKGVPDLLVGVAGINLLIELKSHGKATLTPDETTWHAKWMGQVDIAVEAVHIVRIVIKQLARMSNDQWANAERDRLLALLPQKEATLTMPTPPVLVQEPVILQPSARLVIIDGPKGVGKSTVCKLLVEHLNKNYIPAVYHKHVRDDDHEFEAMTEMLIAATSYKGPVIVVDRLIWTEWVMGIVTGRADDRRLTAQCKLLDRLAKEQDVPHILLHASNYVLRGRLEVRDEPSRRLVDMDWSLVGPMWRAARGQSTAMQITNETPEDQERIINYLLVILGVRGGITHFEPQLQGTP